MTTERLSAVNLLIQEIVNKSGCNPKSTSKIKLNTFEIIDICKRIVKLAGGNDE